MSIYHPDYLLLSHLSTSSHPHRNQDLSFEDLLTSNILQNMVPVSRSGTAAMRESIVMGRKKTGDKSLVRSVDSDS